MDAQNAQTSSVEPGSRSLFAAFGLSSRLLILTILFVMIAEVLIYVPSVANFRRNWLKDRLAPAQIAALVLDPPPEDKLSEEPQGQLLAGRGAPAVPPARGGPPPPLPPGHAPAGGRRGGDARPAPTRGP